MTQENAIPNVNDGQMKLNTGKIWSEWTALLDEWGGERKSVLATARYLKDTCALADFWAQNIAVDYKWSHWKLGGGFQPTQVAPKQVEAVSARR